MFLAVVMQRWGPEVFGPYFGTIPPAWATAAAVAGGLGGMWILGRRGWFRIGRGESGGAGSGVSRVVVWAALFALPVIGVDLLGGFGPAINVAPPWSLTFYPLMAIVAECVFHLAPLGLAAGFAALAPGGGVGPRARETALRGRSGASMAVALIEPALQVAWGEATSPGWARIYVGPHVLAFNLVGLLLFRRYGLWAILGFRLTYYVLWHVVWGVVRLHLLF